MGAVAVSMFREGNKEVVVLNVCMVEEHHKRYFDEPDGYGRLLEACKYVEDAVPELFRDELIGTKFEGVEVKDFSVKALYKEYGRLHVVFSYSLEGMVASLECMLIDLVGEVAKNEI